MREQRGSCMSKPLLDDAVLKLIDAKLLLNGHVTSKDIYRHLGLGRQKVSKVFQDYLAASELRSETK